MKETQDKLKNIISEYTGIDANEINAEESLQLDVGLDSFGMISMISEIEESFNIEIPDYELENFHTIVDMAKFVDKQKTIAG